MSEEGMPRPDVAFAHAVEEQGMIESFCEENYPDNQQECQVMVADKLLGEEQPPHEEEAPEPEPQQEDPVEDLVKGEHADEPGIETMVADCVGGGFLGFHKPNTEACMRVVATHERKKRQ
jgi:hypothetical protein